MLKEILLNVIHCTRIHPFYPFSPFNIFTIPYFFPLPPFPFIFAPFPFFPFLPLFSSPLIFFPGCHFLKYIPPARGIYCACQWIPPPSTGTHFFPPTFEGPKGPVHLRGPQGRDITQARMAETFRGGPWGLGPPENFLKIGFRMVLFQSNFLRMRRNIAAYNTLYTYSSLLSIFSDTPSRPAGPRHHRGRRAKPFGGSGGLCPPGKFYENWV